MIYGYSNYMNSINSFYGYNHNSMKSSYSTANSAGVASGSLALKNGYINSDAIKALTSIRNNAAAMKDSLAAATQATAFKKMYAESSKSEIAAVDPNRSQNPAQRDTQPDVKQAAVTGVNEDTKAGVKQAPVAEANKDTKAEVKQAAAGSVNENKNDTKPATDAVKNFVDSFNKLVGSAKGNPRLTGDLNGAYTAYASGLEKIGITSNLNGMLAVDNDKLAKAAANGSLESFFAETGGSGFTGRLSQIADSAAQGGYGAASASGSNFPPPLSSTSAQNLENAYKYSRNNHSYVYNYLFGTSGGSTLGALFNLYA